MSNNGRRNNDQLTNQMKAGLVFPGFEEGRLGFDPTYKFDVGTDNYDSSKKQRWAHDPLALALAPALALSLALAPAPARARAPAAAAAAAPAPAPAPAPAAAPAPAPAPGFGLGLRLRLRLRLRWSRVARRQQRTPPRPGLLGAPRRRHWSAARPQRPLPLPPPLPQRFAGKVAAPPLQAPVCPGVSASGTAVHPNWSSN